MDSKTTITKPKTMGDVFEKSRKYDALLKENEELKRKQANLQSVIDGYRELLSYRDSIIDRYGEYIGRLCGITYDKQGSTTLSEDFIDILEAVSCDERAMSIRDIFIDEYKKSHPYEGYNPAFDIELLKRVIEV